MTIYTITMSWGDTLRVEANLAEASAPILLEDEDGNFAATQYCTAHATHDEQRMARLIVASMGRDWWLDPSDDDDDLDDDAYIDGVITSVEAEADDEDGAEALRAAHHLGNRSVARAYWGRAGERWYSDLEHNAPILTWADAERT